MSRALTRVVSWGHALLAEVTGGGDLVADLTAGNGYDTLELYRLVGGAGQVVAFDIQARALEQTRQRLAAAGATVRLRSAAAEELPFLAGVDLVAAGHETVAAVLPAPPRAIIANLGYLPGGDRQLITRPATTMTGLQQSVEILAPGGRLAVVVYTGHPGGEEEGAVVDQFFSSLAEETFQVLRLSVANRSEAPYLLVAEKRM